MATIKSYTDISQSKKLAEFLPLESADAHWYDNTLGMRYEQEAKDFYDTSNITYIAAWSLTSLLGVLPFHLIVNNQRYGFDMGKGLDRNGEIYMIRYNIFSTDICLYKTEYYNNPVDAAYEMILKLHESNLL